MTTASLRLEHLIIFLTVLLVSANAVAGQMTTHELSKQALVQAFQEASEHFSELGSLERKLSLPRYLDQELLGEGGAKLVYLTIDQVTGRKLVRAYPKSVEIEDDFLREAMLHAHLEHPNIVPFYDMGLDEGRPFFCMKRIQGDTLEHYVRERHDALSSPVVRNELLDAFLKVCDAVSYAHAHEVLHLDLKPSNIQMSPYGEVLVGDWGLARVSGLNDLESHTSVGLEEGIQSTGQFTRHGYLSGTPGFMAPEQCQKGEQKTPVTDVYALGSLLVYLLTGTPSIIGNSEQIMAATIKGEWSFSFDSIPRGLQPVVRKALAVHSSNRYASVEALSQDINAYRSGYLTSAEEFSSRRLLLTLYRRNKPFIHSLVVSITILLASTAYFFQQIKSSEKAAHQAQSIAIESKQDTEIALDQLQRTQLEKENQEKAFAVEYLNESIKYDALGKRGRFTYLPVRDEQVYLMVTKALEVDPENKKAWAMKGRLAMLTGRMGRAREAYQMAGSQYQIHHQVCSDFRGKSISDVYVLAPMLWELLPTKDLLIINDFIFKTIFRKLPEDQMIYFVEEALNIRNQGDKKRLHFQYDSQRKSLDLSNNKRLSYIFILKNLPLREINLSHTSVRGDYVHLEKLPLVRLNAAYSGMNNARLQHLAGRSIREIILTGCDVSDLTPLRDCPLEIIDIRHTKIKDFSEFSYYKELKTVICTAKQRPLLIKAGVGEEVIEVR